MSDMTTFTARELDRQTTKVLNTCDRQGQVRIRRRNGRSYMLKAEANEWFSMREWIEERQRKVEELFGDVRPMSKKQLREFDRLIRSDRE
jgi:hypothetical protein